LLSLLLLISGHNIFILYIIGSPPFYAQNIWALANCIVNSEV
jgi:hypothetical protein